MTKERQEELLKMLTSADFNDATYEGLTAEETIILCNSAKNMAEKNAEQEKVAFFFGKREEYFRHLVNLRMQKLEEMFVVFSKATNLPFVYCDPDSCNDQIWLFTSENLAKRCVIEQQKEKNELLLVKLLNKDFLGFYMSLFNMGVNELVVDRGGNTINIELTSLVRMPDMKDVPEEKQPIKNAELVLTCAYFAQELRKPVEDKEAGIPQERRETLKELEEEMLVNFKRGKFILPVILPENADQETKLTAKDIRIPFIKIGNGDAYQPICTDIGEFKKFNRDGKLKGLNVPFDKLPAMIAKDVKGLMLNPGSLRMAFPRVRLTGKAEEA
ncbi:MAG: SseB family protein [Eubacteriales bacterium]|nr:SseB family protein [Eubacteriales bacterium]